MWSRVVSTLRDASILYRVLRRATSLPIRYRVARRARSIHRQLDRAITLTPPNDPVLLACVVICRGEDDYLVEWLEFHRMMGVEHFFVYDNGVQPSTKLLLDPYIAEGLVSHIPFPNLDWPGLRRQWFDYSRPSVQEIAYGHCITQYHRHYHFLLKIDVDEFVYPAQQRHATLVEAMRELDLATTIGIEIPMRDFGSNHHTRKPDGLVIESYTKTRAGTRECKSIGNAAFIARKPLSNPHYFTYRVSLRQRLSGATKVRSDSAAALFRLNHYFTKSREEYVRKGEINAGGYMAGKESLSQFLAINRDANRTENREILRFVPTLRQRLAKCERRG